MISVSDRSESGTEETREKLHYKGYESYRKVIYENADEHYGCADPTEPICATHAAAKYIKKLLNDFNGNEWEAVVAYNMGGANYRKSGKATAQAAALADEVVCLFTHDPLHLTSY